MPNYIHSPTTENLILLGLIERFMQLYTLKGYFPVTIPYVPVSLYLCAKREVMMTMMMMMILTSYCISVLAF